MQEESIANLNKILDEDSEIFKFEVRWTQREINRDRERGKRPAPRGDSPEGGPLKKVCLSYFYPFLEDYFENI